MSVRIFLVRHGATAWSVTGQHTGTTDLELLPHGEQQARRLAAALRDIPFAYMASSPRRRARRTAELAGVGAALHIEDDLAEWNYGAYEGLTSAQITRERAGWNIYRDGCPGGETPAQVTTRVDRLLERLRAIDGNVALFTHGHLGRALAMRWVGLDLAAARHFESSPAALSVLGHAAHHADTAVIEQWNGTAHLAEPA